MNNFLDQILEAYGAHAAEAAFRKEKNVDLDPKAVQIAQDELKKAIALGKDEKNVPNAKFGSPSPTRNPEVFVFYAQAKRVWNYGKGSKGAYGQQGVVADSRGNPGKDWNTFVGFFKEKGGSEEAAGGGGEEVRHKALPGDTFALSHYKESEDSLEVFKWLGTIAEQLFNAIPDNIKQLGIPERQAQEWQRGSWGSNAAIFANFVTGAHKSLEAQVAKSIAFKFGKGGEVMVDDDPEPIDLAVVESTVKNLKKFVDSILGGDEIPDDAKRELQNSVAITTKGHVMVFVEGSRKEGLLFPDPTGFFKALVKTAEKKHNFEFKTLVFKGGSGGGNHGVPLEKIRSIFTSTSELKRYKDKYGEEDERYQRIKVATEEMISVRHTELAEFIEVNRSWVRRFTEGDMAVTGEQGEIVESIIDMLGDSENEGNLIKTLKAAISVAKSGSETRKPNIVCRSGAGKGQGTSDDNQEMWFDKNDAIRGLMREGWTEEQAEGKIIQMPAKLAFKDDPETFHYAKKAGLVKAETMLYVHNLSLKSYHSLANGHDLGATLAHRRGDFYEGREDEQRELRPVMLSNLDISDEEGEEFFESAQQAYKRGKNLRDRVSSDVIPDESKFKASDGESVAVDSFKNFSKSIIDNIKNNSTYKAIAGGGGLHSLTKSLESIVSDDKVKPYARERAREKVATFMQIRKQVKEINYDGNDPDKIRQREGAKRDLAVKFFLGAGTKAQGQSVEATSLTKNETYTYNQNEAQSEPLRSFLAGDGDWEMTVGPHPDSISANKGDPEDSVTTIYFTHKSDRSRYVSSKEDPRSAKGGKRLPNSVIRISNGQMKHHHDQKSASSPQPSTPTSESIVESMVNIQKKIISVLSGLSVITAHKS